MDVPCKTCPWRKSSTIGGADIPGFSIEMMRGLSNTVGEGDAFRPIMACHGTAEGVEHVCVGYAVSDEGYSNLALRLGNFDWVAADKACEGIEFWPSFAEMLSAYEEAQNA